MVKYFLKILEMRIAFLLRGITFWKSYIHHTGQIYSINYKNNIDHIMEQIKDIKKMNQVDVYISTNDSILKDEIINDTKPYKFIFNDETCSQSEALLKGLELIDKEYDFIIVSRFDLKLRIPLSQIKYDRLKFNFLWYEVTQDKRIADCMFFFNNIFLDSFKDAVKNNPHKNSMHHILENFKINEGDIHILYPFYYDSNSDKESNPIYEINRGTLLDDLKNYKLLRYLPKKFMR